MIPNASIRNRRILTTACLTLGTYKFTNSPTAVTTKRNNEDNASMTNS